MERQQCLPTVRLPQQTGEQAHLLVQPQASAPVHIRFIDDAHHLEPLHAALLGGMSGGIVMFGRDAQKALGQHLRARITVQSIFVYNAEHLQVRSGVFEQGR